MIKVDKIYKKKEELIIFYQNYLDNHEDASLDILIDDDSISFYLSDREKEDIFIITFNEEDIDTFNYLSIKIIIKIFGNVLMHLDGITLYNDKHKKNIRINILNDRIYDIVKKIIEVQDKVFINDDLPLVVDLNKKVKLSYPEEFMDILNKRIELSKKLFKN